ncbi:MAG: pyroglutamyl-peptidase I [Verrucomicrobiota bacterium]
MAKVLLTGFGDWAGSKNNPAKAVALALSGEQIAGAEVVAHVPPSIFAEMVPSVTEQIDAHKPDVVISMGEYGGRSMMTVERIAQNYLDATRYGIGDEAGQQPQGEIVPGGPAGIYSNLPIRAMVKAMRAAGIPADISDTAATFGCNLLMYGVLYHVTSNKLPIRAGWVHLPAFPETAALEANLGMPSMHLDTQVAGLRAAIEAIMTHEEDITDPVKSLFQY